MIARIGLRVPWERVTKVRRFPLPWIEANDACFGVQDAEGKRVAYVYFKDSDWGKTTDDRSLTRSEALRIARNIVKLPDLLGQLAEKRAAKKGNGMLRKRDGPGENG